MNKLIIGACIHAYDFLSLNFDWKMPQLFGPGLDFYFQNFTEIDSFRISQPDFLVSADWISMPWPTPPVPLSPPRLGPLAHVYLWSLPTPFLPSPALDRNPIWMHVPERASTVHLIRDVFSRCPSAPVLMGMGQEEYCVLALTPPRLQN